MNGRAAKASQEKSAGQAKAHTQASIRRPSVADSHNDLLALQDAAGNEAVGELLQPPADSPPSVANGVPPIVQSVLDTSSGKPLDPTVRTFMEARFGEDFSGVRVHTDVPAAESARAVNAEAYTIGQHITFKAGRYAPDNSSGQHLLAHELAHVVQQERGGTTTPSTSPNTSLEQAANQAALTLTQGNGPVQVAGASAPGLARQPAQDSAPPTAKLYEFNSPSGNKVTLTEDQYRGEIARVSAAIESDIARIEAAVAEGAQNQRAHLANRGAVGAALEWVVETEPPPMSNWSLPNPAVAATRQALAAGNLAEAGRRLLEAQRAAKMAQGAYSLYVRELNVGGEATLQVLEFTRDASFAIAIGAAAIVAAPIVASGVAAAGATGIGATGLTALGTGAVVGTGSGALRAATAAGGSLLSTGKVDKKEVLSEFNKGQREGFVAGMTAGLAPGVGRALGVGSGGSSFGSQMIRKGATGGIVNAAGEGVNATLEGKSAGEVLKASGKGFGIGAAASVTGGVASRAVGNSPVANKAIETGVGALSSGAAAHLSGGSREDVERAFMMGAITSFALAHGGKPSSESPAGIPKIARPKPADTGWNKAKRSAPPSSRSAPKIPPKWARTAAIVASRAWVGVTDAAPGLAGTGGSTGIHAAPKIARLESPSAPSKVKPSSTDAPDVPQQVSPGVVKSAPPAPSVASVSDATTTPARSTARRASSVNVAEPVTPESTAPKAPAESRDAPPKASTKPPAAAKAPTAMPNSPDELAAAAPKAPAVPETAPAAKGPAAKVPAAKSTKPKVPAAKSTKPKVPAAKPPAPVAKGPAAKVPAAKPPAAAVQTLDQRLLEAEAKLNPARQRTLEYQAERSAEGKSLKGGPKKVIDNAKEEIWIIKRQKAYPNRQILEKAEIVGIRKADGDIEHSSTIAGVGREPDFIEIDGSKVMAGELKSTKEIETSVQGGLKTSKTRDLKFREKSKIGGEWLAEDKVIEAAQSQGQKIVVRGYDVKTGKLVEIEVDPKDIGRGLFNYDTEYTQ